VTGGWDIIAKMALAIVKVIVFGLAKISTGSTHLSSISTIYSILIATNSPPSPSLTLILPFPPSILPYLSPPPTPPSPCPSPQSSPSNTNYYSSTCTSYPKE
jgi:hypothetical protein